MEKAGRREDFWIYGIPFDVSSWLVLIRPMRASAARKMGMHVDVDHLADPRVEAEQHYYNAKHSKLLDLGLQPHYLNDSLLDSLMNIALKYRDRVDPTIMLPQVNWREPRNDRRHQTSLATGISVGAAHK